jgi:glycosyltransferase involved in cell wall biosynthesis
MILIIINSDVGKIGNIGFRLHQILKLLDKKQVQYTVICRGCNDKNLNGKIISMGYFSFFCHFLNLIRRLFFKNFNSAKINLRLFEFFTICSLKFVDMNNVKKVYLWEISSVLANLLSKKFIVTEFVMSPVKFSHSQMGSIIDRENLHKEKEVVKKSSLLIAPSKFVYKQLNLLYKKNIKLVYFGSNYFYKKKTKHLYKKKVIEFCFAGLINYRKGIDYLLKAWEDNFFDNHKLYLYGRLFYEQKKLIKKINKKNIIIKHVDNMRDFYKKHDVFIFPTLLEGSSKAVYEAAASSLCIITTKESGSIIQNKKNGIIVKAKSSKAIKYAMKELVNNRKTLIKYSKNSYKESMKWTWEKYAQNIVTILLK